MRSRHPSGLHNVSFYLCVHDSIERKGRCHAYEAPTFYFCLLNHRWQQTLLLQCSFSPYLTNIGKHVFGGEHIVVSGWSQLCKLILDFGILLFVISIRDFTQPIKW
jgi:hypothetical protein